MLPTQINLKSGGCILSLALLGGITLTGAVTPVETVHASAVALPEQSSWLTFAGPWLCRVWTGGERGDTSMSSNVGSGMTSESATSSSPISLAWAENKPAQVKTNNAAGTSEDVISTTTMVGATFGDTTIHCTRKWYVNSLGYIISDMPNWVPDPTGAWPATADVPDYLMHNHRQAVLKIHPKPKPKPKPKPMVFTTTYQQSPSNNIVAIPTGPYSPWAPVPGHPSYGMSDFAGDPNSAFFGYCTWYAWYRNQREPLMRLGNADTWAANAPRFGLRTGTTPVVGATAVFAPGVEGAGGEGHVAHVEAVLGGGWFIVSEMNFSWNGGGWQHVDWRFVYVTSGVSFIY